jgi:hypothetical protein
MENKMLNLLKPEVRAALEEMKDDHERLLEETQQQIMDNEARRTEELRRPGGPNADVIRLIDESIQLKREAVAASEEFSTSR